MKKQAGFTLIELIVVIIILGILAATALPKFADLQDEAKLGAAKGVAGSLSSASSMNYGVRSASNGARGIAVGSCAIAANLSITGVKIQTGVPAADDEYQIADGSITSCTDGIIKCTVRPNALTNASISLPEATVVCAS